MVNTVISFWIIDENSHDKMFFHHSGKKTPFCIKRSVGGKKEADFMQYISCIERRSVV